MKQLLCSAIALVALGNIPVALAQRDTISIVGSSTVYPFSTVVAERFGKSGSFNTPKVESTGTGGGIKLFCAGVGVQYPDVVNASRRMKQGELDDCRKNGVGEVVEVTIGYDGIVVANSIEAPIYDLTPKDLWLALAKAVPNPDGSETLVATGSPRDHVAYLLSTMLLVEGVLLATGGESLKVAEIDLTNLPGLLADDHAFAWERRHDCYLERLPALGLGAYASDPATCP